MKKIFKLLKQSISFLTWTYIYLIMSSMLFIYFWNFNILSGANWNLVYRYWESGGIIHTWKDYVLILFLICYIPTWYFGWKHFRQINWMQILLWPFIKYNQHVINKYSGDSQQITIKNMGTGGIKIEEEIERKSKPQTKIETDAEVNKIRSAVSEKINSVKQ